MEKNKTLQEVYKNSSDEVKKILESKFSYDDLGVKMGEQEIRNEILEIIRKNIEIMQLLNDGCNSDLPKDGLKIYNENNQLLFVINYNEKNKNFWYSYDRIFKMIEAKSGIDYLNFNKIMMNVVENDLNLLGITLESWGRFTSKDIEDALNIRRMGIEKK